MCIVCASGMTPGPGGFVSQRWLDHGMAGAPVVGPLGVTEVTDYRSIVASSWNLGADFRPVYGQGAFISFSFQTSVQDSVLEAGATFNEAFVNSFQPLTLAQTEAARTALRLWGEASGITFFEVPSGMGDIRFGNFDFSTGGPYPPSRAAAYAYYPGTGIGGDVFMGSPNFSSIQIFLHEIGHALGLKHSFDGDLILPRALDNWATTVMSYTSGGNPGNVLGTVDIEAIRYIYGGPDRDGTQVASWSWDAATYTLTQGGTAAAEVIRGMGARNVIDGGAGDDRLIGANETDILRGGAGNDRLEGGAGADVLDGGDGDDTLFDILGDVLNVDGGAGDDTLTLSTTFGRTVNYSLTAALAAGSVVRNVERVSISGSAGNDRITGADTRDSFFGGDGDDVLFGMGGNDSLFGGAGYNIIDGGDGDDSIFVTIGSTFTVDGGAGSDTLQFITDGGTAGVVFSLAEALAGVSTFRNIENVFITGGSGGDRLSGSAGRDLIYGYAGNDILLAGAGADQLIGGAGHDYLEGGDGDDYLDGGDNDDAIDVGIGNDWVNGGAGHDTVLMGLRLSDLGVTYQGNQIVLTAAGVRTTINSGVESIRFADQVVDIGADGRLMAARYVNGTSGADRLTGTAGADNLIGGAGDDILIGGGGSDFLIGGDGFDVAVYSSASRRYSTYGSLVIGGPEGGTDTLSGIEEVRFTDGVRTFDVNSQAAQIMRLYDAALDRGPDPDGFEAVLDYLEAGQSLQQVAALFLNSPEFQARYGALTNQQFIEQMYLFCLNRQGDAQGIADWTARLDGGTTRTEMLVIFSESQEHRILTQPQLSQGLWVADEAALKIARMYDATFDRLPDSAGLGVWTANLKGGMSMLDIATAFAASAEFQQRYGAVSNEQFIRQMYQFTLNRQPDEAGLASWTAALNAGTSRAQMLLNFSESAEHIALTRGLWIGGVSLSDPLPTATAAVDSLGKDAGPLILPGVDVADDFWGWDGQEQPDDGIVIVVDPFDPVFVQDPQNWLFDASQFNNRQTLHDWVV